MGAVRNYGTPRLHFHHDPLKVPIQHYNCFYFILGPNEKQWLKLILGCSRLFIRARVLPFFFQLFVSYQ